MKALSATMNSNEIDWDFATCIMLFYRLLSTTHSKKLAYLLRKNATEWFSGGSRGRVQGVRTPPWDDLRFSNTTGILQKKKKEVWFIGVEVEQETSAPTS